MDQQQGGIVGEKLQNGDEHLFGVHRRFCFWHLSFAKGPVNPTQGTRHTAPALCVPARRSCEGPLHAFPHILWGRWILNTCQGKIIPLLFTTFFLGGIAMDGVMMKDRKSARGNRMILTAAFLCFCVSFGCEQAGKIVDDVKSEVSGTPAETTPEPPVQITPPVAPVPVVAAPVMSPEEIVARFLKLKPWEISNNDLTQLASDPMAGDQIVEIDLTGNSIVTLEGLAKLVALKNLASLSLASTQTLGGDLTVLAGHESLQELSLAATRINDSVVEQLSAIPHLRTLNLSKTQITAAAGSGLSRVKELADLDLTETAVNDQTIGLISALPLQRLVLSRTQISGLAVQELLRLSTLESLNVSMTAVPGIAWKGYKGANLKELDVSDTPFGIAGFDAIKGMRSLEVLSVYKSGLVEHKKADVFGSMPKLRLLNAGHNAVSDAGMEVFFKGLKGLEELHLAHNSAITDSGLAALVGMKSLRLLDVTGTKCGAAGATALKKKLPECKILTNQGTF